MAKVKICETVLRDAHQSLVATRMTTEQMLPILEEMDKVGYYALEAWGGATFDACLRFLDEDPWERLRKIRDKVKNTKLQMLFRGQNILGYRHYADDVVEYFVRKSIANGMDILRIFDALNDPRNLKTAIDATIKEGGHVQAAISYTTSPVHTNEGFAKYAKQLEEMGANSICIKDMAGLLKPYDAYDKAECKDSRSASYALYIRSCLYDRAKGYRGGRRYSRYGYFSSRYGHEPAAYGVARCSPCRNRI